MDEMLPLKVAVIGNQGGWSTERLADAVGARTAYRHVVDLSRVTLDLERGLAREGDLDLLTLDGLILKKVGRRYEPRHLDRLEMLRYVQGRGVPIFSDPASVARVIDRLSCTVTLRINRIPMPPTVVTEDVDEARSAVGRFGSAVFKPLFTTKARGMRVIRDGPDAKGQILAFQREGNRLMYLQAMVDLPGRDLGVAFVGGEYLGTYARVGREGSWNTTSREGGRYEACEPSREVIDLARRAQAPFGLDFASVDVAECEGGPRVFEVSAFGGFRGLLEGAGVDAASRVADHVLGKVARDR